MTKIKKTYVNSHNKKLVREFILQKITFEKVIGLPGPDINVYLERFEKKGVKDFEIYEIDSNKPEKIKQEDIKTNAYGTDNIRC